MSRNRYIINRLLPFLFVGFLILPALNDWVEIFPKGINTENRAKAQKPIFDISKLDPFPKQYEAYFNDDFSFREHFNNLLKKNQYLILDVNPMQGKVVIGKHNWMFFNNEMLPNKRSKNKFTKEELEDIKKELLARNSFLKKHDCEYYFVVIPTKSIVYQDSLPDYYQRESFKHEKTLKDQLIEKMEATDVSIIDLESTLKDKKSSNQIFLKYDHHWNQLGAFYACQIVLEEINKDFPKSISKNIKISDYEIDYKETNLGVLAGMLGLSSQFTDLEPWLKPINNEIYIKELPKKGYTLKEKFVFENEYELRYSSNSGSLLKCMIIRDSFAQYYTSFLSRGFSETVYIWDNWRYQLNKEIFLQEKPDILITMILDKHLKKIIQHNEFLK